MVRDRHATLESELSRNAKADPNAPVLVSACLLGLRTRWDGTDRRSADIIGMLRGCCVIPICPEQLGGLPTPRAPAEIERGDGGDVLQGSARVIAEDGRDVTGCYLRGAQESLGLAQMFSVRRAVLKDASPACGARRIKRLGRDVPGMGVTAALLKREGIEIEGIA